jgi:LmbE family N-acetylglucosaminyl deacetylase
MPRIHAVVSPHLDDAALSCSLLLAANPGSSITTVFSGGPSAVRPLPPWDKAARYFAPGSDVMGERRREDADGAALIRASTVHLGYWDRQYRSESYGYRGPEDGDLESAIAADLIARAAAGPRSWVIPLGLGHPDHRMAAAAGLLLAEHLEADIYVYEELPYAAENADELASRKRELRQRGFALEPADAVEIGQDRALKRRVIACHASQRRSLRRRIKVAVRAQERVWVLTKR